MNTKNFIYLRGIAIALVVLFHLDNNMFNFGFVGVDIFFVISSFLISKTLEEKKYKLNNYFSYLERRFFRIFPPLIAVIIISVIFSYFFLYPESFVFFAKSTIFTMFGLADLFFLNNVDYFAPQAYHIPSIHFWSLGVEIKFYILMPLLLLIFKKNKKLLIILSILSILIYIVFKDINNNFYLFLLKFPHFITGSCLYYFTKKNSYLYNFVNNEKIINNFFFLIFPIFLIIYKTADKNTQLTSLISIFLSIILILCSNSKIYNLFLNNKLFNNLGKVSYSLYLVHWPIIVFYTIFSKGAVSDKIKFSNLEILFLITSIIFFAYIIFILYEKKFINIKFNNSKSIQLYISFFLILILSTFIIYKNGLWSRLNVNIDNIIINYDSFNLKQEQENRKIKTSAYTKFKDSEANNILILGDSYGRDIYSSLIISNSSNNRKSNINLKLYDTFSQYCFVSLLNYKSINENIDKKYKCKSSIKKIILDENFKNAKTIIISYRFGAFYRENWKENILSLKNIKKNEIFINKNIILINRRIEFYHFLHSTVMTEILLYKIRETVPFIKIGNLENIFNQQYALEEGITINKLLEETLSNTGVIYFDIKKLQSNINKSKIQFNTMGQSLYLDSVSHFSMAGRLYFGNLLLKSDIFKTLIYK
jgi:peptidoglycan/LPS O-acetylase OafA/YrhL